MTGFTKFFVPISRFAMSRYWRAFGFVSVNNHYFILPMRTLVALTALVAVLAESDIVAMVFPGYAV